MASRDLESRGAAKNTADNAAASTSRPLPFYTESPERQWTSWLVPLVVVANVAVFILTMFINNCPKNRPQKSQRCIGRFLGRFSFQPLPENPFFGPSDHTLSKLGGLTWFKVVNGHQGWRLITCNWLHAGVIHLFLNMFGLVIIGSRLEQQFGFVRIGIIYVVSGFGGSVLSALFVRNSTSVGASGGVLGLLGAMLAELLTNWTIYYDKVAALSALVINVVIILALGILPFVSNYGHIGGFITGFLLGFVLLVRPQNGWALSQNFPDASRVESKHKVYQYILWIISLILLIIGFVFALLMLFRGVDANKHCHWCRYLDCVPTKKWRCDY